jgi:hypothetical protein
MGVLMTAEEGESMKIEKCRSDYKDGDCTCAEPTVCVIEWGFMGGAVNIHPEDAHMKYKEFAQKHKNTNFHEKYLEYVKKSWYEHA